MSYAKGKNFNVVFLPLRYSAGDTYRGSGLVFLNVSQYPHICIICTQVSKVSVHKYGICYLLYIFFTGKVDLVKSN